MKFLLSFILVILLVGYLISLLLPWLMRLWFRRVQKQFGGDPPRKGTVNHSQQKKRINPSEGDYIDFEEIE